jgi:hypothetical protein
MKAPTHIVSRLEATVRKACAAAAALGVFSPAFIDLFGPTQTSLLTQSPFSSLEVLDGRYHQHDQTGLLRHKKGGHDG